MVYNKQQSTHKNWEEWTMWKSGTMRTAGVWNGNIVSICITKGKNKTITAYSNQEQKVTYTYFNIFIQINIEYSAASSITW